MRYRYNLEVKISGDTCYSVIHTLVQLGADMLKQYLLHLKVDDSVSGHYGLSANYEYDLTVDN